MVSSMTGFSRQTLEDQWGTLTWEIRSVNHRFLEISVRMPEGLRQLEMSVREHLQAKLKRGKVDVSLKFSPGNKVPFDLVVNESLLAQLARAAKTVGEHFPGSNVNQLDVLSWHGVLETRQTQMEAVAAAALTLLDKAIDELVMVRLREGGGLQTFIKERLADVRNNISIVEQRLPLVAAQVREKVLARFSELSIDLDSDRLEQEMVWVVQKMDVAEEIQRLGAHVQEAEHVLQQDKAIGRRLDFIMQEFNREANTLGSKSNDAEVTKAVVDLKVQIEQMREQVQNIE